ncbi:hypothetical protein PS647_01695 [Pseudomonas fluorescens]|nr:hypothetical protein PS647_01004 [Pseudomonas fluorescens]VVM69110.1 hypothetical protein PS647_01695 [Pseudomonas fluorescens]
MALSARKECSVRPLPEANICSNILMLDCGRYVDD